MGGEVGAKGYLRCWLCGAEPEIIDRPQFEGPMRWYMGCTTHEDECNSTGEYATTEAEVKAKWFNENNR
jgi:hypothetical protein